MFWDPEPSNDAAADQPVWCLGCNYRLNTEQASTRHDERDGTEKTEQTQKHEAKDAGARPVNAPQTPPDSTTSSFSSVGYEGTPQDGDWPADFVNDFESKFWMTYRNEFTPIPRSSDPKATAALSLSMRIKSQLGDPNGFSSDTGWGCMIRSGQSLLANTLSILRLGRGNRHCQEIQSMTRLTINRLETRPKAGRREGTTVIIRGRSTSAILNTQLCQPWRLSMWQISGRVVWAVRHCALYTV